jgi:hypothetical protein
MGRKRPWIEEDTAIQILVGIGAAVILGAMTKFGLFDGDDPQNDRDDDQPEDLMAELRQTLQRLNTDMGVQINGGQVTINNYGPQPPLPETPESSDSESGSSTTETPGTSPSSGSSGTGTPASPEQTVAVKYDLAPMRAQGRKSNWGGKVGLECSDGNLLTIPVIATVRSCPANLLVWAAVRTDDMRWYGLYPTKTANRSGTKDFLFCIATKIWKDADVLLFVAKEDQGDAADQLWQQKCQDWGELYGNGMLDRPEWRQFAIDRNTDLPLFRDRDGDSMGSVMLGLGTPAFQTVAITLSLK